LTLIAVAPNTFARGVEPPGHRDRTYDWRETGAGNSQRVRPAYVVMPLEQAFTQEYDTDAHLVTYVVSRDHRPLERQPRVNKGGLDWLLSEGYEVNVDALFCDVDNPGHQEWTDELRAEFAAQLATLPVLSTVGAHETLHGYHLIQLLDEPVAVPSVERYLDGWLDELTKAGIAADPACRDWTRHFRLPHVKRGGGFYRSPLVDLSRMTPRAITPKPSPGVNDAGKSDPDA